MSRIVFFLSLCMLSASFLFAKNGAENTGIIKGTITTADNKPAVAATVQLKGSKKAVLSNETGEFSLVNIEPGSYELQVSLIGYETSMQSVTVEAGETVT